MADVRLTATNPEDSSAVPVACNSKGELLLEEPQTVVGPEGPQGPPGNDGQDGAPGDPFSGNFTGDVSFDGDADISGELSVNGSLSTGVTAGDSTITIHQDTGSFGALIVKQGANQTVKITGAGNVTLNGTISFGALDIESLAELTSNAT